MTVIEADHKIERSFPLSIMAFQWQPKFIQGDPFDRINWTKRTAKIGSSDGRVIFEQKDVEVPEFWSQTATDIVASKYFSGKKNSPERETSIKQLMNRVAKTDRKSVV